MIKIQIVWSILVIAFPMIWTYDFWRFLVVLCIFANIPPSLAFALCFLSKRSNSELFSSNCLIYNEIVFDWGKIHLRLWKNEHFITQWAFKAKFKLVEIQKLCIFKYSISKYFRNIFVMLKTTASGLNLCERSPSYA